MTKQVTGTSGHISESDLQEAVSQLARLLGFKMQYHTYNSQHSAQGFPDLVLVNGAKQRVVFVELKSEIGQVSEHQLLWFGALTQAGAEVYVWRPSDWKDGSIEKILKGK